MGCCGWPEGKAKYFERFPVVELQSTFYEPPSVALAAKWRDLAPPSFQFCVKAWQLITHQTSSPTYRRLRSKLAANEHEAVGAFRPTEQVWLAWERTSNVAQALRARVILFQCPASFEPDPQNVTNLRAFFSRVERGDFLLAWEPRGDWSDDLVRGLCSELDLIHCVDPFQRESVHGHSVYWRLHGQGGYSYKYSDADLDQLRRKVERLTSDGRGPVYTLFNNIWMKDDAVRFQRQVAR